MGFTSLCWISVRKPLATSRLAGLLDLLLILVLALALVDGHVVLGTQIFLCPGHYLLFGDLLQPVESRHLVGPVGAVGEGVHEGHRTALVGVHDLHLATLVVGDGRLQQFFVELAVAQLLHLCQQQVAHLLERLSLFRSAEQEDGAAVGHHLVESTRVEHFLLLGQIHVQQTALVVAQDRADQLGDLGIFAARAAGGGPCHPYHSGLQTVNLRRLGGGDGFLGRCGELRQFGIGLQRAEILVDQGDHLVGIEVAREADGHVIGHVVGLVVVLDVGDRGVFQVFLKTQDAVLPVGVVRVEQSGDRVENLLVVARERHVVLLVDGLQLGVETADHVVGEAVGLDLGPILHLIRGDVLRVDRLVVGGPGVAAVRTDGGHQLVVFVGDRQLRRLLRYGIDPGVDRLALLRVGRAAVDLEELFDLVEQRLLGGVVLRAEPLGALEHQMLEVVGQTGRLDRVILRAHPHGDIGLDARLLAVDRHVDLQSVVERVDAGLQRIARDALVLVLAAGRQQQGDGGDQ